MKRLLPAIIIILFIVLSVGSTFSESLTFDEIVHAEEGINALTRHTFLIDTYNPPLIREIAMAPIVFGVKFPARFVVILLGVALLIAVYLTVKHYFGRTQALVALFLLALEPTTLAHSHYVTLDTGFTLFFFLAYIAFLRLMERYSIRRLILTGITLGLAASSKILALPFFVGSVLIAGLSLFHANFKRTVMSIPRMSLCIVISAFVVWGTYFFTKDVIIAPREDSGRISSRLHEYAIRNHNNLLQTSLTILETQKLPLGNYLAVLKNMLIRGGQKQQTFFLGSFYDHPRWYFMPVTLLYKLPLPLWILFGLGLLAGGLTYTGKRNTALFAIPFFVIVVTSSLSNIQPWVRYTLPAMPFLVIIASQSVMILFTRFQKILFLLLCLWYALSVSQSFPHFITYANELAGPPNVRFTKFMDSNLDWGQSLPDIAGYISQTKPSHVRLSYFGRDNGDVYGLASTLPYGSHRYEDICAFHEIDLPYPGPKEIFISVSNWYYCGYSKGPKYSRKNIQQVIGNSVLLFYE